MAKKMRNSDIPVCRIEMKTRRREKIERRRGTLGRASNVSTHRKREKGKILTKSGPNSSSLMKDKTKPDYQTLGRTNSKPQEGSKKGAVDVQKPPVGHPTSPQKLQRPGSTVKADRCKVLNEKKLKKNPTPSPISIKPTF